MLSKNNSTEKTITILKTVTVYTPMFIFLKRETFLVCFHLAIDFIKPHNLIAA